MAGGVAEDRLAVGRVIEAPQLGPGRPAARRDLAVAACSRLDLLPQLTQRVPVACPGAPLAQHVGDLGAPLRERQPGPYGISRMDRLHGAVGPVAGDCGPRGTPDMYRDRCGHVDRPLAVPRGWPFARARGDWRPGPVRHLSRPA